MLHHTAPFDDSNYVGNTIVSNSFPFSGISIYCNHSSVFSSISKDIFNPTSWILDIETTDHMVSSFKFFSSFTPINDKFVVPCNGHSAPITNVGTVYYSEYLFFFDVLCIISFTFNLISISKLTISLVIHFFSLTTCALFKI